MKLLTTGNPKTDKSVKYGYLTAVMHLAPYKAAGVNVCPMAELASCHVGCLNAAGRGGIAKGNSRFSPYGIELPDNHIQRARIKRTRFYAEDRRGFLAQLRKEIAAHVRRADRAGLTPCVRLNGTSDIQWELVAPELFADFDFVQFYDYTKIAKRFRRKLPANYHLSLSYSEASPRYMDQSVKAMLLHNAPAVVVVRDEAAKARIMASHTQKRRVVDGDEHDLRFLDPAGAVVYLKAKGPARHDRTGFVLD